MCGTAPASALKPPRTSRGTALPEEIVIILIVTAAVVGLLILVFWVLPWLIELGGEPDDSVPASEIIRRIEDER